MFKKKWVWVVIVIVVIGIVLFVRARSAGPEILEEITVTQSSLASSISVTGTVDREQRLDLAFQAFGTVKKIYVSEGDRVTAGTLLAQLEAQDLAAQLEEASIALTIAEQKRLDSRRARNKALSPEEKENFELAVDQAQAQRAQVVAALAKTRLTAPIDGVITKIDATEGEFAKEQTVMNIADGLLRIEALVSEADIAQLRVGQEATVTLDALPDREPLTATIADIAQQATVIQDVVYYEVDFDLSEQIDALRIGMSADVAIVLHEKDAALTVPLRVVTQDVDGSFVQVKNADGSLARRAVSTGIVGDTGRVEILDGLSDGETVVVVAE